MNFYIADTHFGHQNVIKFDGRPFSNVEEMDLFIIQAWNNTVSKQDDIYILGDFCYRSNHSAEWYLKQLNGRKHLIQGNHDGHLIKDDTAMKCIESLDKMLFVQDEGKRVVLSHYPIAEWNGFYKGAYHLYGHIHNRVTDTSVFMQSRERAFNVGCMLHGYRPIAINELISK